MTGVYRPWREIAAELASGKELAKALELAHELNCAMESQGFGPEEERQPISPLLPSP
jgi:hypothetical protein